MRGEIKPLTGDQIQVVTSDQDNSLYARVTNFEMEFYADAYKILDYALGFYILKFRLLNKLLNLIKAYCTDVHFLFMRMGMQGFM